MLTTRCYTVSMVRTQIQLTEEDYQQLRRVAGQQGRSMADCIREGIGLFLIRCQSPREAVQNLPTFRPLPLDDLKDHDRGWAESILSGP